MKGMVSEKVRVKKRGGQGASDEDFILSLYYVAGSSPSLSMQFQ